MSSSLNIENNEKCAAIKNGALSNGKKALPGTVSTADDGLVCRCNYLAFSEPQFEADVVRKRICSGLGQPAEYIGFTRSVLMHFEFGATDASMDSFNVTFESESELYT